MKDPYDWYAVKLIDKVQIIRNDFENYITREIDHLVMINSDNVVSLKLVVQDLNFYYLALEYCNLGTLSNFIKIRDRLKDFECQIILKQLVKGITDMHSKSSMNKL